jgi:hypothetical protein
MDRIPKPSGIADKMSTIRRHRVVLLLLETLLSDEIAGMLTGVNDSALRPELRQGCMGMALEENASWGRRLTAPIGILLRAALPSRRRL